MQYKSLLVVIMKNFKFFFCFLEIFCKTLNKAFDIVTYFEASTLNLVYCLLSRYKIDLNIDFLNFLYSYLNYNWML